MNEQWVKIYDQLMSSKIKSAAELENQAAKITKNSGSGVIRFGSSTIACPEFLMPAQSEGQ